MSERKEKIFKENLTNKNSPCPNTPSPINKGLEGRRNLSIQTHQLYSAIGINQNIFKKKATFQNIYQIQCGQVLNSFKNACLHQCSQGGHGVKGGKCGFFVFAHSLRLKFKSFYGIWDFFKEKGKRLSNPDHSHSSYLIS